MKTPRICILKTDGTNCDVETAFAFTLAGGHSEIIHINQLRRGAQRLNDYHILAIPGGFSYGDDIASGKVLAGELVSFLARQVRQFVDDGKLILGICNGFQVLVRTGLLPFNTLGHMQSTLAHNNSGSFHCKWHPIEVERSNCVFTRGMIEQIELQLAHAEGKFMASREDIARLEANGQIALRYSHAVPNGSTNNIAGVCDATGRIFGLMPHPERFVMAQQYPNWRRYKDLKPQGLPIFQNAVAYAALL